MERLLYDTDRSGVSVYDINDSLRLPRKIELPDTGDHRGISSSVPLGRLYLTSYRKNDWDKWPPQKPPVLRQNAINDLIDQAKDQLNAADGTPIE